MSLTRSTEEVVAWLFDVDELPSEVEWAARSLLLDTLGCMVGGAAKPELRSLGAALASMESGPVSLPGLDEPLTAAAAAYWSALAATWDEACEGLARAHGRPGLHAFGVAVALTLARSGTLGDALLAVVRGYEVGGRLGERLRIRPGMHVDGTWGTFGAVAAAGSVLGHDHRLVMAAIEAAACQIPISLYLPVGQGATARNTYVAEAARRAIALSLSVGAGVTAPSGALEALEEIALGEASDASPLAPVGEWLVTQGYLKPYSAVRHVHYGVEAAKRWRRSIGSRIAADSIESIALDVYPEAVTYCGNRAPSTAIEAQFSLTYGLARMLVHGDLGPDAYTEAALADPEVHRLERLIVVRALRRHSPDHRYATVRIAVGGSESEEITIDGVAGDADSPMTPADVRAKFVAYSDWLPPPWSPDDVATAILQGPLDVPLIEAIERA